MKKALRLMAITKRFKYEYADSRIQATTDTKGLISGVLSGNRVALSRAITLAESTNAKHQEQAELLLERILTERQKAGTGIGSFRIGISGPPGAGKSTLIEALGIMLIEQGHRVAVLAVDPSSSRTHGSILGDKTRMPELAVNAHAYVRPSPSRGTLGGVAQHTNDIVLLCEASGYDIILVESVGLGQSETTIDETVDVVLLIVPPGGGDELQGSKKGIMEVADIIVVNKADGDLQSAAKHTMVEYRRAIQLVARKNPQWTPMVVMCSALENNVMVANVLKSILQFREVMSETGQISVKRDFQRSQWMWNQLKNQLISVVMKDPVLAKMAGDLRKDLVTGHTCPRTAARLLLSNFLKNRE